MKVIHFFLCHGVLAIVSAIPTFDDEWKAFKMAYNKEYNTSRGESQRREIFRKNLKEIELHNLLHARGLTTFTMGLNEYADMEPDEFARLMNGGDTSNATTEGSMFLPPSNIVTLPGTVDWRKKGYVTNVKNQKACGSCWAFAATGSLEGQTYKETRKLISLSEQNLVDCDKRSNGCRGGLMTYAFTYIKENGGIDTGRSYPYTAKQGVCRFRRSDVGAKVTGYVMVSRSETALKQAVATVGPIAVTIDGSRQSFHLYKSGVYNDPMCSSHCTSCHAVLVVGYGTFNNMDYWLVKNSWGTTWGMQGYVMIRRNKNNLCGIANRASYPLV